MCQIGFFGMTVNLIIQKSKFCKIEKEDTLIVTLRQIMLLNSIRKLVKGHVEDLYGFFNIIPWFLYRRNKLRMACQAIFELDLIVKSKIICHVWVSRFFSITHNLSEIRCVAYLSYSAITFASVLKFLIKNFQIFGQK